MEKLVVVINGQPKIEYDRNIRLPGHQRKFLDKMDQDMNAGIELSGQTIASPDINDRAKYIAMHLVMAVIDSNDATISAMCAYLATKLPELQQVKAVDSDGSVELELVFDQGHKSQVSVNFENNLH